jgi:vacuolar-type H+-ATPase subunit D/Vma8
MTNIDETQRTESFLTKDTQKEGQASTKQLTDTRIHEIVSKLEACLLSHLSTRRYKEQCGLLDELLSEISRLRNALDYAKEKLGELPVEKKEDR